ncbi:hypothetical protein [Helicobacter sp. MIT 11-5569]|uniref:hypothetical protein n=1 Tax=Helicobacter sp. MIT 11-5569 TaxID=1548151 RepID=UPI0013758089|nr:hypothetical protein [Helicobacter sp. MIT 11-5569]
MPILDLWDLLDSKGKILTTIEVNKNANREDFVFYIMRNFSKELGLSMEDGVTFREEKTDEK